MYLVSLQGHFDVGLAVGQREPDRVQALDEAGALLLDGAQHGGADAGHDLHRHHDVGGVGDLDAVHRHVGLDVAHDERDDVHRATGHAPPVEVGHQGLHLGRRLPVVREAGVLLVLGADEGTVLDAGDVARVGDRVEAVRLLVRVQPGEGAAVDQPRRQKVPLLVGTVDPVDRVRGGESRDFVDPGRQACVTRAGCVLRLRGHGGPSAGLAQLVGHPSRVPLESARDGGSAPARGSLVSTVGLSTEG